MPNIITFISFNVMQNSADFFQDMVYISHQLQ